MRVLIVYATRGGCAAKAASLLGSYFRDVKICDLEKTRPDPKFYDVVIFGSGIRFGTIYKPLMAWLDTYWDVVRPKLKGLFICNALMDEAPQILRDNFSLELRNSCVIAESLGGEFDIDSLPASDRVMLKLRKKELVSGQVREFVPCLQPDRVRAFAQAMLEAMEEEKQRRTGNRKKGKVCRAE
ncbi:MAG: flavodoxin domain-containing protein [Lachnospiraceae bacterium]|nr:flavodoxin domain-containing protein [Lachnospiraceae bacterium]